MNKIIVLVDFTETANISLEQGIVIASLNNSSIILCHISDSFSNDNDEHILRKMEPYKSMVEKKGLGVEVMIGHGGLVPECTRIAQKLKPSFLVVGTHGKVGLIQHLFGSNIYDLVKNLPCPTLVINDRTKVISGGFNRILLTVAADSDYLAKVEHCRMLLAKDGVMIVFALLKPGMSIDLKVERNVTATKKFLTEHNVKWEYHEMDSNIFSVGYSKETLKAVQGLEVDMISIMTEVSDSEFYYGKIDRENLLLNEQGLPVLSTNL